MKKARVAIVVLFLALATGALALSRHTPPADDVCDASPKPQNGYVVGVLGDSWVDSSRLDDGIRLALHQHNIDAVVKSSGISSAKSAAILARAADFIPSLCRGYPERHLIVIIEGGINDAFAYVGKEAFANNMERIVQLALSCRAVPVVLTIPAFNRYGVPRSWLTRLHWRVSRTISGDSENDVGEYNDMLKGVMLPLTSGSKATLLNFDDAIPTKDKASSYIDGVHPSMKQSDEIGKQLGEALAHHLQ